MTNVKFFEEWDPNTSIEWWNEGRTKLNVIIRTFNSYQKRRMLGKASEEARLELLADIEEAIQTWASVDGGGGWREGLEQMREELNNSDGN